MAEKILLAVILTFSLNLFAQMSLSSPSQGMEEKISLQNQEAVAVSQLRK